MKKEPIIALAMVGWIALMILIWTGRHHVSKAETDKNFKELTDPVRHDPMP